MGSICAVCKKEVLVFFIWSTSRNFKRYKLMKLTNKEDKISRNRVMNDEYPVCRVCCEKYGLLE